VVAGISLALIASAETLLCAAAVDRMQHEVRTDYNRELFAQGIGNTLCGLLGGLPMTGVIVRSSANVEAGAKTRLSAILHGLWLFLLVAFAPFLLRLVPTASLAGVLVYTGFKLVSPSHLRELRTFGWGAVGIYIVTLAGVVGKDLLTGVVIGLMLSVLRLLRKLGSFEIDVKQQPGSPRLDVTFRGALTFVGLPKLASTLESLPAAQEIHLHVDQLRYIDHACLVAIGDFERQARQRFLTQRGRLRERARSRAHDRFAHAQRGRRARDDREPDARRARLAGRGSHRATGPVRRRGRAAPHRRRRRR